ASALAVAVGIVLVAVPDTISGFMGLADFTGGDRGGAGNPEAGVDVLNTVALVGSAHLLVGALGWLVTGVLRLRGARSLADPWGAHTLEWSTSSVKVTSESPLLDAAVEVGA
ncbi:MAG: hypothetical protein QF521_25970, partial [Alphaproteobacteria bacterium]|nr:hypothetical protein [Alphaproteobacteria bacterium]